MEKAAGVPLFEQWGKMAEIDKLKLRKNLTGLEAQLAAIRLPAYGGLYRRADVNRFQRQELSRSIDLFNLFCIGPSCDRSFSADSAVDVSTQSGDLDQGPSWHEVQQLAQECLDTDTEGWIVPQFNIEEKRRQNRKLLSLYMKQMAAEKSPGEARALWQFLGS
ncbi:hypothetical protein BDV40DRAFT_295699 [Aspergillus tamarii]|uniref:Uncharacterized protein n=1 Tax=Aspergillus tamarii TaxID=41984 RepID=A0A5N6VB42_ASPTM|nr:hypothetical protein BDV40DRAFT_295699 [Aspergillus tamarii]